MVGILFLGIAGAMISIAGLQGETVWNEDVYVWILLVSPCLIVFSLQFLLCAAGLHKCCYGILLAAAAGTVWLFLEAEVFNPWGNEHIIYATFYQYALVLIAVGLSAKGLHMVIRRKIKAKHK